MVFTGNGKIRTVELTYTQRLLESAVKEDQANPQCVGADQQGECFETYEIDTTENFQTSENYDAEFLESTCKDNAQFIVERIAAMMDVLDRRIGTQVANDSIAFTGKYANDVSGVNATDELVVRTAQGVNPNTSNMNSFTMQTISRALNKTGYCAVPVCFAGDDLSEYYERVLQGCCTDQGVNIQELAAKFGKVVVYDRRVQAALGGQDKALVLQTGALQLINYWKTGWKAGMGEEFFTGANYATRTVTSPLSGVTYDFNVKDDCGTVNMALTGTIKLVGMPTDMFPTGDTYDGVTFVNKILVDNS